MARIAGVNLPNHKPIWVALTSIFGIGPTRAKKALAAVKIEPSRRTSDLNDSEVESIRAVIEKEYSVEGELRMQVNQNVKRLKEIGTYRGDRHSRRLPVRGQRTKTNARTKRGKRMNVGSGRKPAASKT